MDTLGDMDLFVRVVRNGGLAAAGREVGLSPASMSARMNRLEEHYGVRLLSRTTRKVAPTDEGNRFFRACQRVLAEVEHAEFELQSGRERVAGPLRVTATSDLGQQHVAAVLDAFGTEHPDVRPYLHLTDGVINLVEDGFDVGVRYGVLADSRLIARKLASNNRLLCASPSYIDRAGNPTTPQDLANHACLAMIRISEPLTTWYFQSANQQDAVTIQPSRSSNDGAQIRRWALSGHGIALKSYWDIKDDLAEGRLVPVLEKFSADFEHKGVAGGADLNVVYPSREYLPARIRLFVEELLSHFSEDSRDA